MESSLAFAIGNRTSPPRRCWHYRPEHHLRHCLFSQGRNPVQQYSISKDATEKHVAPTVAYSRSGMDGYEFRDHFSQQRLRPIGGYFESFYSSVSGISEELFFQQAVYFSYTSRQNICFGLALNHAGSRSAWNIYCY